MSSGFFLDSRSHRQCDSLLKSYLTLWLPSLHHSQCNLQHSELCRLVVPCQSIGGPVLLPPYCSWYFKCHCHALKSLQICFHHIILIELGKLDLISCYHSSSNIFYSMLFQCPGKPFSLPGHHLCPSNSLLPFTRHIHHHSDINLPPTTSLSL